MLGYCTINQIGMPSTQGDIINKEFPGNDEKQLEAV